MSVSLFSEQVNAVQQLFTYCKAAAAASRQDGDNVVGQCQVHKTYKLNTNGTGVKHGRQG